MNERQERTADVLGKLTVLGTIVLPMNIICGMWGMNVKVPGQDVDNLYWFWSSMLIVEFVCICQLLTCRSYCRPTLFWSCLLLCRQTSLPNCLEYNWQGLVLLIVQSSLCFCRTIPGGTSLSSHPRIYRWNEGDDMT